MTGAPPAPTTRRIPRYYVLEVLGLDAARESMQFSVVSGSCPGWLTAWGAAGEMCRLHPGRVFIAGELCAELNEAT